MNKNQGAYSGYGYDTSYSKGGTDGSGYGYDYSGYYQGDTSSGYGYGSGSGGNTGTGTSSSGYGSGTTSNQSGGGYGKLQEQLAFRESQLAMASNLLEQQSQLITQVSTNIDPVNNNRGSYGGGGGYDDRKRKMSDYGSDYKRRRTDSRSYNDDRRDGRRGNDGGYGGYGGGGNRWGGRRSPQRFGGGGGGRDRGRDRFRDRRGGGGGGGGRSGPPGRRDGKFGGKGKKFGDVKGEKPKKQPKKPKITPWVSKELSRTYCHVCEVECFNERNFQNHQTGIRHREKLSELEDNPTRKAEVEERMKKQEEERAKPEPEKIAVDHCDICDVDIHVPLENHLKFKQHRQRELQVKKGCAWCNVGGFGNFSEVLAHRLTEEHQEYREQYGGRYRPDVIPKPEYMEATDVPDFEANTPYGKDYVVPVTGFYCKLCLRFYKKESQARAAHCMTEGHYATWKQAKIDAISDYAKKLIDQNEREEAAAQRIAELAKKKEEALAALKGLNGEESNMETDGFTAEPAAPSTMETEPSVTESSVTEPSVTEPEAEPEPEPESIEDTSAADLSQETSEKLSQEVPAEQEEDAAPAGRTRRSSRGRAKGRSKK